MKLRALIFAAGLLIGCGNDGPNKQPKPDVCVGVSECVNDDFCCPSGCTTDTDSDCSATSGDAECGNGVLEPGELCDGDCPTSCDAGDACAPLRLVGAADACTANCAAVPVESCVNDDGCCAPGCDESTDSDCVAGCGNGVLEPGELCDGNCPTSCDDGAACTTDALVGSASTCSSMCTNTPITACVSGDGCCPMGCDQSDTDCSCTPTTCAAAGAECGTIADGCGGTLSCPSTCAGNETCSGTTCVTAPNNGSVGAACASNAQCAGFPNAYCEMHPDYTDGYCTAECQFDNDCPSGSHCARLFAGDPDRKKICMKNCSSDADCRADGYGCQNWDSFVQDDPQTSTECGPAATGTGQVGDMCDGLADCAPGSDCLNAPDFPGGMCTTQCLPIIAPCPAGQGCSDSGYCAPACITSAQCRSGYTCTVGQFSQTGYCWP